MSRPLVVVGDALLDVDVEGRAERLCPDAPAPVLSEPREHARPGGAGLAAALAATGQEVVLVTALGDDEAGGRVEVGLEGVEVVRLPYDGDTPVKRRLRAAGQTLLRLDTGIGGAVTGTLPGRAREALRESAAVLVSDYGRGVTGHQELRGLLESLTRDVPVVWDPHPRGATPVRGTRVVTPNLAEGADVARRIGVPSRAGRHLLAAVHEHAAALVAHWRVHAVAVTMGERGALLAYGDGLPQLVPAEPVPGADPCGAGDAFAAGVATSLAHGALVAEAVADGVGAAGRFLAAGGASGWRRAEPAVPGPGDAWSTVAAVRARGGTVVATGGCFDLVHAGHVATLEAARRLGDCLVVCLNSDDSVRRLKGPGRPLVGQADRTRVLQALACVDGVVVFDEDTPTAVLSRLQPDVWVKGGDYAGGRLAETEVLARWGGQAVTLPYLRGRSTSRLVDTAIARSGTGGREHPRDEGGQR